MPKEEISKGQATCIGCFFIFVIMVVSSALNGKKIIVHHRSAPVQVEEEFNRLPRLEERKNVSSPTTGGERQFLPEKKSCSS